eukprot:108912-Heterocapsa_arctica.AAC.1
MCTEVAKKNDYRKFHEQLGKCMKLGIHEGSMNRTKMAEFLRWHISKLSDEQIRLNGYVNCMKDGQKYIEEKYDNYKKFYEQFD